MHIILSIKNKNVFLNNTVHHNPKKAVRKYFKSDINNHVKLNISQTQHCYFGLFNNDAIFWGKYLEASPWQIETYCAAEDSTQPIFQFIVFLFQVNFSL